MTSAAESELTRLRIAPGQKTRRARGPVVLIVSIILLALGGAGVLVVTRHRSTPQPPEVSPAAAAAPAQPGDTVLTVSGYVIPRERVEISPRFQGTVAWIGVKKGDAVHRGDVIVRLDDSEYQARVLEAEGRLALGQANLTNAELTLQRALNLAASQVDSAQRVDDARRARDAAAAEVKMAQGTLALARTYLDWCTIRAPIDGTILEKLVDPNELVVPQSFGGSRGPSTAFVAMADLRDLQVEIDLNEADTPKVRLKQRCRISPEAYPDKQYQGYVAEIAPEANRQKGTLQVKVQIDQPDNFLTPELTAKVDFLAD